MKKLIRSAEEILAMSRNKMDVAADLEEVTIDKFVNEDIVRNEFLTKLLNAWNQE